MKNSTSFSNNREQLTYVADICRNIKCSLIFFFYCIFFFSSFAQETSTAPAGNLFIIGGGNRSPELIKQMIATAQLASKDYIAILPMASAEPDSSFYYIKKDLQMVCSNTIAYLNFTQSNINNRKWLDSLQHAKLIFITGGDQSRFMKAVMHTPVYDAIHKAYNAGATIAGTSAGAAVISRYMITGNQLTSDTVYHETFDKLRINNIEFEEGLGLLDSVIIDQHFIVRSRYNRLVSALAQHPSFTCIGIDEATAIVVHRRKITVAGEGQVVLIKNPDHLNITANGLIKFNDLQISIFPAGDSFDLK